MREENEKIMTKENNGDNREIGRDEEDVEGKEEKKEVKETIQEEGPENQHHEEEKRRKRNASSTYYSSPSVIIINPSELIIEVVRDNYAAINLKNGPLVLRQLKVDCSVRRRKKDTTAPDTLNT